MATYSSSDPFDDFNPYRPPAEKKIEANPDSVTDQLLSALAGRVDPQLMFAWEKQRLLYNAVLAVWVVLISFIFGGPEVLLKVEWWFSVIVGAFAANFCYCVGPVAEFYLTILGGPVKPMRLLVFFLGVVCAMMLAAVSLAQYL